MDTQIPLTQGKFAIVDDKNLEKVLRHTWYACRFEDHWYAYARVNGIVVSLHRFLFDTDEIDLDHKNGNGLDCREANVRAATRSQNMQNARPYRGGSSEYKGVSRKRNRFQAKIAFEGKRIFLGSFENEEDAARAYDEAAIKYFGEFARPNFPRREVVC